MNTLGQALREQRIKKNYTQQDVADMLGISRRQYINYELHDSMPPHRQLKKLNNLYQCDFSKLIYNGLK